jgi:hypothetical protein
MSSVNLDKLTAPPLGMEDEDDVDIPTHGHQAQTQVGEGLIPVDTAAAEDDNRSRLDVFKARVELALEMGAKFKEVPTRTVFTQDMIEAVESQTYQEWEQSLVYVCSLQRD